MSVLAFTLLRKPPAAENVPPVCVAFGDEPYLQRSVVDLLREKVLGDEEDLALSRYEGPSAKVGSVLKDVSTLPFFAPRRMVIVEAADEFVTANRKELESYVDKPARSGVLVLTVKTWLKATNLAKKVEAVGLAIDCNAPREPELPSFINQLAQAKYGLKLEPEAARLLVELTGPEVGLLASEIDKLASYVGATKVITYADVAKMVGSGRVEEIWTIIEEASTGSGAKALIHLDNLLTSGEPHVKIMAAFTVSLLKIYHAGQLRVNRVPPGQAAIEAGIPSAGYEKMLRQHTHLGPTRNANLPEMLVKADYDIKGGSALSPNAILERLIVELARPRKD